MNLAALKAASNGDIANLFAAATPGGIELQEAQGQQKLVASQMIPKEIRGATRDQLQAIGFVFGDDCDELFVNCQLPVGWTKKATTHSMHSDLLDEKGRVRAGIFYKAAFYDRRAEMGMMARYRVNSYAGDSDKVYQVEVQDAGTPIKSFGEYEKEDYKKHDVLTAQAESWLTKTYPDWKNCMVYW